MNIWLAIIGAFILGAVISASVSSYLIFLAFRIMMENEEMFIFNYKQGWMPYNPFLKRKE